MTGNGPEDFPAAGDDDRSPFGDGDDGRAQPGGEGAGLGGEGAGLGGEGAGFGEQDPGEDFETGDYDDIESEPGDYDAEIAATFRPVPGGAACFFEPAQAGVIRSLVSQVAELIRSDRAPAAGEQASSGGADELEMLLGLSANDELPEDPVLARLLPDAYRDDPGASAEFRRYTEESLRSGKLSSAQAVLAALPADGGEVVLSEPECQQWLRALNDVRLALGTRLGITDENEDFGADLSINDPRSVHIWVYQWLAYLQDSLIDSLS
jgi:hypothetical protein